MKQAGGAEPENWRFGLVNAQQLLLLLPISVAVSTNSGHTRAPASTTPAPAPLVPNWPPTYDLQRSLAAMPCNESGWSNAVDFAKIGIVTYDMNNAHDVWEAAIPSSPEEVLEQQCAKTKAISKGVKCGVYRNSAHMWSNYRTVRKALQDPSYWGYFLPWANTTARNYSSDRAGENLYYDTTQTPHLAIAPWNGKCQCVDQSSAYGAKPCTDGPVCECGEGLPCGQFMFDFRNTSLLDWLLNDYIGGPLGLGSPNVDFVFLDDEWDDPAGPSEVGPNALAKMGLSKVDVTELTAAYWKTMRAMQEGIVARGGFEWHAFSTGAPINPTAAPLDTSAGRPFDNSPTSCTKYMREIACRPDSLLQKATLFYGLTRNPDYPPFTGASDINNTVAAFMLIRGAHAFLGWSWVSCSGDCFNNKCPPPPGNQIHYDFTLGGLTDVDYGVPTEICHETSPGSAVFVREWSKATVALNCSEWSTSIKLKESR